MRDALATSIDDLDGTFFFRVSTRDEIAYAKDRLAVKPAIMYETDDLVAVASEEVSLNRLFPGAGPEHQGAAAGDLCHMVTIDPASTSVREAKEFIRRYGADGTGVTESTRAPDGARLNPVVDST